MKKIYFLLAIGFTHIIFAQHPDSTFNGNGFVAAPTLYDGINEIETPTDIIYEPSTQKLVMLNQFNGAGATLQRFNADGSYDVDFGFGGTQQYEKDAYDYFNNVFFADGSYRITGYTSPDDDDYIDYYPRILEATYDGPLNTSFGVDGIITEYSVEHLISESSCRGNSGKYILAGWQINYGIKGGIMMFNADGSFNTTFGYDSLDLEYETHFKAVAELPDGRIIAGGYTYDETHHYYVAFIACYKTDGTLDATFGTDGIVFPDPGFIPTGYEIDNIVVDNDGNIYAAGHLYLAPDSEIMIYKCDDSGNTQLDYGINGFTHVTINTFIECRQLLISESNSLYVLGTSHPSGDATIQTHIFKLLSDGNPDESFTNGTPGAFKVNLPGISEYYDVLGTDMVMQDDGKIALIGLTDGVSANDDFFIGRITTNETPTAITEIQTPTLLSLFPNPATDHITIQSNTIIQNIEVFSIDGKEIDHKKINATSYTLTSEKYVSGLYIIRLTSMDGETSEHYFMKQ